MKHIQMISKNVPAPALLGLDHPGVLQSLVGFIADPLGTLQVHFKKVEEAN